MGWFTMKMAEWIKDYEFSSPLGDGLVLMKTEKKIVAYHIFVPEWGWVGSR